MVNENGRTAPMNKLIWVFGAILIVVAVAGAVLISRTQDVQEKSIQAAHEEASGNAAVGATGSTTVIHYTDTGFSPAALTVYPGATVTWSNESSHGLWVLAEGAARTCPLAPSDSALNECASIAAGGSFSHTFTTAGTVSYLNKERATDSGSVTVSGSDSSAPPAGPLNANVILQ